MSASDFFVRAVHTNNNQHSQTALIEARNLSKDFLGVHALRNVSLTVNSGETLCLLGDNGAGKSTLIKLLSGVFPPSSGEILVRGDSVAFGSPRAALDAGIATVYQDLAMVSVMPVVRNFFLGREPRKGRGIFRRVDWRAAAEVAERELERVSIKLRDPNQPVMTLSGGERQSLAIARAVHFGASVLILDEPTAALGVREASYVLRHIVTARDQGLGVVLISHNVAHAWLVGDRFAILKHGECVGTYARDEVSREELQSLMAGGEEIDELAREFDRIR
jgi:simple sugar transport system ATP-binding protein